jgi:hypothetical protein
MIQKRRERKGKEGKYVFNRRIDKKDVWSG